MCKNKQQETVRFEHLQGQELVVISKVLSANVKSVPRGLIGGEPKPTAILTIVFERGICNTYHFEETAQVASVLSSLLHALRNKPCKRKRKERPASEPVNLMPPPDEYEVCGISRKYRFYAIDGLHVIHLSKVVSVSVVCNALLIDYGDVIVTRIDMKSLGDAKIVSLDIMDELKALAKTCCSSKPTDESEPELVECVPYVKFRTTDGEGFIAPQGIGSIRIIHTVPLKANTSREIILEVSSAEHSDNTTCFRMRTYKQALEVAEEIKATAKKINA